MVIFYSYVSLPKDNAEGDAAASAPAVASRRAQHAGSTCRIPDENLGLTCFVQFHVNITDG